jgi:hypothetical protein
MTPRCGSFFKVGILTDRLLGAAGESAVAGCLKKTGFPVEEAAGSLEILLVQTSRVEPVSRSLTPEIQAMTTGGCFSGK